MSYTYAEALNAMEKIARDLLVASYPNVHFSVRVASDTITGTASVDWHGNPRVDSYVRVTINMPVRPATYRMNEDEFRHWAGYILHEIGHPNETDMVVWKEATSTNRHRLLNSLEDVREELCTIKRGIANNAIPVFSRLIDMLHAKAVAGGYDPNAVESIGWTLSTLGRKANGYAIDCDDIPQRLDPNGIVGKIVPWALSDLAACTSTQDCLDLSDKVVAAVRAAKKAEKEAEVLPEPEPVEEMPDLDLEDLFNEEDVTHITPEPQGGQRENREPQPDNSSDIPDEEPEAGEGSFLGAPDTEEPEADEPEDEEEFSDKDIEEVDLKPNDRDDMVSTGRDAATHSYLNSVLRGIANSPDAARDAPICGRSVGGSVDMVTGNASKMGKQRALLARALKANELDSYDGNRAHGRLNTRALGRFAAGNMNVFGKRHVVEGYDTDVQVLVDGSGSMSGQRILAASSLALVVAQAAGQVGVDCYAHVFNDNGLHFATKGKSKPKPNKFAYMYNQIMGGTPLTENLLLAAKMQNERAQGKRKILFVITDGGCNNGPDVVRAAGQYIEDVYKTEIANLHIGSQCMGIFRNEAAVNVRKVEETGLKQLTTLLERGL